MLLRANTLAKGNSGARVETVELLLECLNRGVVPRRAEPRLGRRVAATSRRSRISRCRSSARARRSSTASGCPALEALARVGLEPMRLAAKEGLSLDQRHAVHGRVRALGLVRARRLAHAADLACALSLEALQGSRTSFLPQIHALRPLRGQGDSAANVLRLLDGSAIIEAHRWCDKVQDAYSLRCAPQVHGASRDLLDYVDYTVSVELNAATDNPLVLVDDDMLVSNGNFHGQPLAFALDALAMAVSELASISERRVERLVNPNLSDGLPAFLTDRRRSQQRLHDPAVRRRVPRLARTRCCAIPRRVDSIPTSAGQEDHVSMGNAAGLKAWQVLANCERALGDRAARGRAGGRVPRAARAGRGRPRDAGGGARAVAAAAGRPVARAGHRGGGGCDPRRIAARRRRGGSGGVAMSVTQTLAARVDALCGDLSSIRAPRGTELNARQWSTEAPLRMLLNNLDREVAEKPEELIVYGGSGKAARNHDALRAIVGALLELGADETLLVQSGKPVGVFTTHENAPRVLIANSLLVPKWATWDEFRRLEAEGLTMFGQMTAGSWIYIGTQGILQGTFQTFAAAGEKHFGSPDLRGRTILTAGLGGMGGAQPLAGTMAGAAILCVEVDPHRIERRLETRYLDEATDSLDDALARVRAAAAERRPLSVGLLGNAADVVPGARGARRARSTSSPTRPRRTIR